jgi:hypothetical protein
MNNTPSKTAQKPMKGLFQAPSSLVAFYPAGSLLLGVILFVPLWKENEKCSATITSSNQQCLASVSSERLPMAQEDLRRREDELHTND